jgi:hypothetical protein
MKIEAGKTAPIIDEEDRLLADVWKSRPLDQLKGKTGAFPFRSPGFSITGDPGDDEDGNRPQLSDIEYLGSEAYSDASGMTRFRAKFKVYNSSGEDISKFSVALTLSDQQGGID